MGGADKAALTVGGRAILARVIDALGPHCAAIALVGRARAPDPLVPLADAAPGHEGPLSGILAALRWSPTPWIVTAPCDTPFLPEDLVPRLAAAARAAPEALVIRTATLDQDHPTVALWHRDLAPQLATAFDGGTRSIRAFTSGLPCALATWLPGDRDPFMNVNRPDDLALAERLAQSA